MLIVRDPASIAAVRDLELQALLTDRMKALAEYEPYNPDEHGYFIVLQDGDTTAALTQEMRFPILQNRFTGAAFGEAGFTPCAEVIEEAPRWFDLVYVIGDSGYGINLFVPKDADLPPEILAMCIQYALRAQEVRDS